VTAFGAAESDATTLADITSAAGKSSAVFYRYFDDKKQIYLEIIRSHSEAALRNVMAGLQPERFLGKARHETIRMALDVLFDHVASEGPLLRTLIETGPRDPDIAAIQRLQDDEARQRLAVLLSFVVPRAVCPDPAAMAYVIHAAATECAFTVNGLRGAPPVPAEPIKAALVDMFERALFPAGG